MSNLSDLLSLDEDLKMTFGTDSDENAKLRRRVMCVICKIRRRKILYMKCHHLALCQVCDANVHHCPICGELVKAFLEVKWNNGDDN